MVIMISINTLKKEYLIDDNLEDKFIIPNIKKCQDFVIRPVLGVTKYNQLLNDIENNTVSQADDTLIKEYIQPVIAYYCMSEVTYSTAYKLKNNPDYQNNQNVDRFNELIKISKKYLDDSKNYQNILLEYICKNNIVLPTTDSDVKVNTFSTGIFLG